MTVDLPYTPEEPFPIRLGGGLDTETPVLQQNPGWLLGVENYEPKPEGGYARVGNAERYDGSQAPSATEIVVVGTDGAFEAVAVGDTVVGAPSAASGTCVYASTTLLALAAVTGTFATGDTLTVGGIEVGIANADPDTSARDLDIAKAAAEDWRRTFIGEVPGVGPVRGVGVLYGVVYAWRDEDESTQKVYKATTSGWVEVPMLHRVAFTGGTAEYFEGDTLTQGGVSATVRRVVVQDGDPDQWSAGTPASGYLILSDISGGSFASGVAGGDGVCTLSGAQEAITLTAGGRWVFKPHNFFGGLTKRLYGADGVNDLIEFDGEILVPIPVSMPVKPTTLELHKSHLWAAFGTSVQRSGIQYPYIWTVLTGSVELANGDPVSELVSVAGSETEAAMLVLGLDKSSVIYGDSADFRIATLSTEVGVRPYTAQILGPVIGLDAEGMRHFPPTQAFGNFRHETISDHIRRKVVDLSPRASIVSRRLGRYRLFLSDGAVLVGAPGQKRWSWTFCRYPFVVNVAAEGEVDEVSRIFVGCDDGYVRELDKGRSHDGEEVEAWMKTVFTSLGKPGWRKKVTRGELEVEADSAGTINYTMEADYGDSNLMGALQVTESTPPPALRWDVDAWDVGVWDGTSGQTMRMRARLAGENVSVTVFCRSTHELPHQLHSINLPFRLLRRLR